MKTAIHKRAVISEDVSFSSNEKGTGDRNRALFRTPPAPWEATPLGAVHIIGHWIRFANHRKQAKVSYLFLLLFRFLGVHFLDLNLFARTKMNTPILGPQHRGGIGPLRLGHGVHLGLIDSDSHILPPLGERL